MKKVTFSITPIPPFVSLSFDVPLDKAVRGLFNQSINLTGAGELIVWCLQQILSDQFTEGDAAGAWSNRYPDYMRFVYGDSIPSDVSIRDTISYSAIIANALNTYRTELPDRNLSRVILPSLQLLQDYLIRHHDNKIGGFGLARINTRGERRIHVDLRHTIWAVLTLWEFGGSDLKINEILRRAGEYINRELTTLDSQHERAITFAVVHRLLSTEGAHNILMLSEKSRIAALKRIESILVEKFDESYGSWDLDSDPVDKAGIDNALFILSTVPLIHCLDKELVSILQIAVRRLCDTSLVYVDAVENSVGLPFFDGGEPDLGATLQLLWIVWKNRQVLEYDHNLLNSLVSFVTDPSNRDNIKEFSYTWHLASALQLASDAH